MQELLLDTLGKKVNPSSPGMYETSIKRGRSLDELTTNQVVL